MAYKHLRRQGWDVNRKRVHRVWRECELRATPTKRASGQKALGSAENSIWNFPPERPHHVWSLDFKHDVTSNGTPYRILNVIDEYTRRHMGVLVDRSIGTRKVQQHLERLFRAHGRPGIIRTDNGREFIAGELGVWLTGQGIDPRAVEKGRPQQNGYIESFHRTMGRYLLDWEKFDSVLEARTVIAAWCKTYNSGHYHSALDDLTPNEFARAWYKATRDGEPTPSPQLRRAPGQRYARTTPVGG
jgi:transposase InsO family protein